MVAGIAGLYYTGALFAARLPFIAVQVCAVLLMLAARARTPRTPTHPTHPVHLCNRQMNSPRIMAVAPQTW